MRPLYPKEGELFKQNSRARIDYTNANEGYVVVRVFDLNPNKKFKVHQQLGDKSQNFNAHPISDEVYIPLLFGSGVYNIIVYRQINGGDSDRYNTALSISLNVELVDEFRPWLYPTAYASYFPGSKVEEVSFALIKGAKNDFERFNAILHGVMDRLEYDSELAKTVSHETSFYIPSPEFVLMYGKGICFGYASVVAALARIAGIPCKIVVGWAGNQYHAWNEVYLHNKGKFAPDCPETEENSWNIVDVTFADGMNNIKIFYDLIESDFYKVHYYG